MASIRTFPTRRGLVPLALGAMLALAFGISPAGAQTSSTAQQFASGAVTSVHGTSVQVSNQAQNSESTVVLAPDTQVVKRVVSTASAVTVGACVRVTGTGSAAKGIVARSVAVSAATADGCNTGPGGAGGWAGGFRSGNGQPPRDFGGNGPSGSGRVNATRPANFALASGPVVSVTGDTVVVKSTTFSRPGTAGAKTKRAKSKATKGAAKPTTADVTVTLAGTTAITQTVAGAASDVTVGSCVTATGTNSAGSVEAQRLTVSQPVNGSCTGGFGFGGRGGAGTGAGGTV